MQTRQQNRSSDRREQHPTQECPAGLDDPVEREG
jgi:hypothetical protein